MDMQQKLLLFIALWLIAMRSVWAQTATAPAGSGTESDPYRVASIENLYWISQTTDAWDAYFEQTADIDATETSTWDDGEGFSPIGNSTTQFTGNYNGQGYTITNLTINSPSDKYVGLFGYMNGATINSLGLVHVNIKGNFDVGGLVGYNSYECEINYCYSTGTVSGDSEVGGLVGGNTRESQINNCYFAGSVSGDNRVGGLVGKNYVSPQINNCYSTGSVSGEYVYRWLAGNE